MLQKIKKKVKIITRTSGQLENLSFAEKAIQKKEIDLIAVGRNFIKDPTFIYKYSKLKKKK